MACKMNSSMPLFIQQQRKVTIRPTMGLPISATGADFKQLKIRTLNGSKIRFPKFCFDYDGNGGEGTAYTTPTSSENNSLIPISFDVQTISFPPLTSSRAEVFGLPFPPLVTVHIFPDLLQGTINTQSGQVELEFRGNFWFNVGAYKARPLPVDIVVTSEESKGKIFKTQRGERIGRDGNCRLIGVATLNPVEGDQAMNCLLGLPTECQTDLRATISFS